ncbi:MAG: hypothetical protein CM1200mP13_03940 [Candidatus Pelagibacterales bacterium]|nr:MAG: hypothetical protein CM1200mP13_03940 [Pelagibacterales bacterium]
MVLVLHLLTSLHNSWLRPEDGGDGKCGSPDGYLKKAVHEDFPKTHLMQQQRLRKCHSLQVKLVQWQL